MALPRMLISGPGQPTLDEKGFVDVGGFDWRTPERSEQYVFESLGPDLRRTGALAGVTSCTLDWSIYRRVRGSGDLSVRTATPVVWPAVRVRVWCVVTNHTGRRPIPLMTGICRAPDSLWTPGGYTVDVELHELTMLLDEWLLDAPFTVLKDAYVVDVVHAIFAQLDVGNVHVVPTDARMPADRTWLPVNGSTTTEDTGEGTDGVSWLTILNDLAEVAGYWSVHTDAMGNFQFKPYSNPGDRIAGWTFADDGDSLRYQPQIGDQPLQVIPYNRWVYWSRGDDENDPVKHERANLDPTDPLSIPSLGYEVTRRKADLEGDVAATIDRDMSDDLADQRTYTVPVRFVPIRPDDAAWLVNNASRLRVRGTVSQMSLTCTPNSPLELTMRGVRP